MSKLTSIVSATIVVFFTLPNLWASPQSQVPPEGSSESQSNVTLPTDNMQITEAPPSHLTEAPQIHYYPYQQQLTLRTGVVGDFPKINMDNSVIGFQYLFPKFLSPKLEAGADLQNGGDGQIHAGARWIYNERGYFRPSAKASIDVYVHSDQGLATFAGLSNYYFRATGTVEYVVYNPYSIRIEPEILFSFKQTLLMLTVGVSHGW